MTSEDRLAEMEEKLAALTAQLVAAMTRAAEPVTVRLEREPNLTLLNELPIWLGTGEIGPFLSRFDKLAQMGGIPVESRRNVLEWKLGGAALRVLKSIEEGASWEQTKRRLHERFGMEVSPQEKLKRILQLEQNQNERAVEFLERLLETMEGIHLEGTGVTTLARFLDGLVGEPGRQTRAAAPTTVEKALDIAQRWEQEQRRARPVTRSARSALESAPVRHWTYPEPSFAGRCFNCELVGHRSRDCRVKKETPLTPKKKTPWKEASSGQVCFRCRKSGHFIRECPQSTTIRAVIGEEGTSQKLEHPKDDGLNEPRH